MKDRNLPSVRQVIDTFNKEGITVASLCPIPGVCYDVLFLGGRGIVVQMYTKDWYISEETYY